MQLVYLSNRPDILNQTLKLAKRNLSFISSILIVCPKNIAPKFNTNLFPTVFVHDYQLLGKNDKISDHGIRNYLLRKELIINNFTESIFIMSDDDSRPIKTVNKSFFITPDGRMNLYYFYDLKYWKSNTTEFDQVQLRSKRVLEKEHMSTLSFASHMPQIIDSIIFKKCILFFENNHKPLNVCEWTVYGNYALNMHKTKFNKPQPYSTLAWPDYPNMWPLFVEPINIHFENYYPHLYNKNDIFNDLNKIPIQAQQEYDYIEKIKRYDQLRLSYSMPPLTNKSDFIRVLTKIAEPAFRLIFKYKQKKLDKLKKQSSSNI